MNFLSIHHKHEIPQDYLENFIKAFMQFKFQVIYDPISKEQKYLNHEDFLYITNAIQLKKRTDKLLNEYFEDCMIDKIFNFENFQFLGLIQQNNYHHNISEIAVKMTFAAQNVPKFQFEPVRHLPSRIMPQLIISSVNNTSLNILQKQISPEFEKKTKPQINQKEYIQKNIQFLNEIEVNEEKQQIQTEQKFIIKSQKTIIDSFSSLNKVDQQPIKSIVTKKRQSNLEQFMPIIPTKIQKIDSDQYPKTRNDSRSASLKKQ